MSSWASSANWLVCANGDTACTVWEIRAVSVDRVRLAIGWGGAATLGSGAITLGSGATTLGSGAATIGLGAIGATTRRSCGGVTRDGCAGDGGGGRYAKIAQRLSIARSWSSAQLGDQSERIAMVSDCKQWIMRSSVVSEGIVRVWCLKVTVSKTTTACEVVLLSL